MRQLAEMAAIIHILNPKPELLEFHFISVDNNVVDVICEDCRQQVLRGPMDL